MKMYNTKDGGFSFVFSKEERAGFLSDLNSIGILPLFTDEPEVAEENPFKCMRKNTLQFLKDLKDNFGTEKMIDVNSTLFKELRRKNSIYDFFGQVNGKRGMKEKGIMETITGLNGRTSQVKLLKYPK